MAKTATPTKKRQRAKSGLLTRVLILILLVGICAQLYTLRGQVERAQTDQELLAAQVDAQRRPVPGTEFDIPCDCLILSAGLIPEGTTPEKMEELAREELGLVTPDEYVFYDVSN